MKLSFGQKGEDKAVRYLTKKGYKVLTRNYRCKYGEIDIIAEDNGTLVFIEVKARTSDIFGQGFEAVTKPKQQKLAKTAMHYMSENGEMPARFDVISIDRGIISHITNAIT